MADRDELLKGAGRLFTKLGSSVRSAGSQIKQTTKQVTGLGRGEIKLELEQTKLAPGATLRGRVVLAITEPVDAKAVSVTLRARQKVMTVTKTQSGKTVGTSHADVYEHTQQAAGAQRFEAGAFPFELVVPPDALDLRPSAGANPLADAVRTVASALSPSAGPIEWQVIAKLEIAWGRDLTATTDIVVAR